MTIKSVLENLPRRPCLYWIVLYNSVFVLSSIFLFSAGCYFLAIILISSYFASGCQYCDFPSTLRLNNNSLAAIYFYSVRSKLRCPLSTCSIDVCGEITIPICPAPITSITSFFIFFCLPSSDCLCSIVILIQRFLLHSAADSVSGGAADRPSRTFHI